MCDFLVYMHTLGTSYYLFVSPLARNAVAPYIVYAPLKQLVQPSGDQVVECTVSGGIRSVRWTKDGQRVAVSNGTLVQGACSMPICPNMQSYIALSLALHSL